VDRVFSSCEEKRGGGGTFFGSSGQEAFIISERKGEKR